MKNLLTLSGIIFFLNGNINAQDTTAAELDLLKAPTSPGFILLNKEPTDIERPTTPTDFMVGLRNATDDFSSLPKNYAVELAPWWLFGSKSISYEDLLDTNGKAIGNHIKQTLTLSFALASSDDENSNSQLGFGAKFSILRGKHISQKFLDAAMKASKILSGINDLVGLDTVRRIITVHYKTLINKPGASNDSITKWTNDLSKALVIYQNNTGGLKNLIDSITLLNKDLAQKLTDFKGNYPEELSKAVLTKENELKKLAETKLERYGWSLDLAGGIVADFPEMIFDSVTVPKYGAWLTLANEGKKGITFLIVARDLFQKDESYTAEDDAVRVADLNHLDGGLRLIYDKNKFSLSGEFLFRMTKGPDDIKSDNKSAWKAMLNTSYDLGHNKIITFNLGRDFDGTVTKGGNFVAALNLVLGFGNTRNIKN